MKIYQNPEFSVISLANEDILTMSLANGNSILNEYSFNDVIGS